MASIDRVEIETIVTGVKLNDPNVEIFFEDNDKLTIWKDSYVALGSPSLWDEVKILILPQSSKPMAKKPKGESVREGFGDE